MSLQQQGWLILRPRQPPKVTEINHEAMANIVEYRFSHARKLPSSSFGTSPDTSTEKMLTGPQNVDNLACALGAGQVRTGARTRGERRKESMGTDPTAW